jgi:hypothetical protein
VLIAARAEAAIILARAAETADAREEIKQLDWSCLPEDYCRWLVLELATYGMDEVATIIRADPPRLPEHILDSNQLKLDGRLFGLYDQLRLFFLRDSLAYAWLDASISGLTPAARILVSAIGHLAQIWVSRVQGKPLGAPRLTLLENVAADLDLSRGLLVERDRGADNTEHLYHEGAPRIYDQVWSCAMHSLTAAEIVDFAQWWARTDSGARALRYPSATRALAVAVYTTLGAAAATVGELLELAERSARADEETTVLVGELVECASAWGQCRFPAKAQGLWCELLDVGCGVYCRKDYQFNDVLAALKLAHQQDPDSTLGRVREQMALAHQLVGTARSKTVEVAIEDLITFVSTISPALALRMIEREEDVIYRARALHGVVPALLDSGVVDRRLVLALVATMGRWTNYAEFDEQTKPTMFAVYAAALRGREFNTARRAYDLARQIFLVEKELPAELGRWAATWIEAGQAPPDVEADHAAHSHLQSPNGEPPAPALPLAASGNMKNLSRTSPRSHKVTSPSLNGGSTSWKARRLLEIACSSWTGFTMIGLGLWAKSLERSGPRAKPRSSTAASPNSRTLLLIYRVKGMRLRGPGCRSCWWILYRQQASRLLASLAWAGSSSSSNWANGLTASSHPQGPPIS